MTFLAWPGGWEGGVDGRREWREGARRERVEWMERMYRRMKWVGNGSWKVDEGKIRGERWRSVDECQRNGERMKEEGTILGQVVEGEWRKRDPKWMELVEWGGSSTIEIWVKRGSGGRGMKREWSD